MPETQPTGPMVQGGPRYANLTGTISAGQSLSTTFDCSAGRPVFIHMPQSWTPAVFSFQVSPDNVTFNDLFDSRAAEILSNVAAGTSVLIEPMWGPITYLKIRSGPRAAPVPQEADRTIIITIDTQG